MVKKPHKILAPATPRPVRPNPAKQQAIIAACETFIATVLKPRFLPEIRPTRYNYPIDIRGEWRAGRYRFIQRFRSGMEQNAGAEFDAPFTRLDHMGPDRFDIYWIRHTGQWWPLYQRLTLADALRSIEDDEHLHPT